MQGGWSQALPVDVYRRLTITSLSASVVGGFMRAVWAHDGSTGNNSQRRFRVQVFDSNRRFVTGTSDRPEEPFRARAVLGDDLSFTFNRTAENSLGPVKNGTYTVVVTLWDAYGNRSEERSTSVSVTNTAPAAVAVTPRVYNHLDQVQTGADGRQDQGADSRRICWGSVRECYRAYTLSGWNAGTSPAPTAGLWKTNRNKSPTCRSVPQPLCAGGTMT